MFTILLHCTEYNMYVYYLLLMRVTLNFMNVTCSTQVNTCSTYIFIIVNQTLTCMKLTRLYVDICMNTTYNYWPWFFWTVPFSSKVSGVPRIQGTWWCHIQRRWLSGPQSPNLCPHHPYCCEQKCEANIKLCTRNL